MLFTIILMLGLFATLADIIHFHRLWHKTPAPHRYIFAILAALTDALPFAVALSGYLCQDNTPAVMTFSLWAFYVWILTVPPRVIYYFFNFLHLNWLGIVGGICFAAAFLWGGTLGRTTLRITRPEICSPCLPKGFDGFRIAQITDIHLGTLINPEKELTRIVDSVNALHPDLIVFCGDMVNIRGKEFDARSKRILSRLEAPYGVVAVTGNHDSGVYIKDSINSPHAETLRQVIDGQREMGWRVLEDTTVYLTRGGDSISLSGISFDVTLRFRRHDPDLPPAHIPATYRNVPDSLYNITVVHLPQLWPQITSAGYGDLTLSGHVHSMQMKFRLFGRDWSPAQVLYKRWSGRYNDKGRTLYISDGTGYVAYPVRLGAYPEITLLTLRQCE